MGEEPLREVDWEEVFFEEEEEADEEGDNLEWQLQEYFESRGIFNIV